MLTILAGKIEMTRRVDIPLLTDAFLQGFSRSTGCSSTGLTPDAQDMLLQYEWPGNVRELHNAPDVNNEAPKSAVRRSVPLQPAS